MNNIFLNYDNDYKLKLKEYNRQIRRDNYKRLDKNHIRKTQLINYSKIDINNIKIPPIIFLYKDTIEAVNYISINYPGYKISILNFANGKYPGGGYINGAIAQEEDICRKLPEFYTSLLYSKFKSMHTCYPFGAATKKRYSSVLWTDNVLIKRDKNLNYITDKNKWKSIGIVSAAAPNINGNDYYDNSEINKTVNNIFITPVKFSNTNILILGAWGCGAFGNNPVKIAKLFRDAILNGMASKYTIICFAIPGIYNDRTNINSYVFYKILKKAKLINYVVNN